MNDYKIILNHMPPEDSRILSSTSSTLKNFLNYHGLKTSIIYWNLKLAELQSSFIWSNSANMMNDSENFLLLFLNYLALKEKDKKAYINVQARLMSIKPNHTTSEIAFFDKHMKLHAKKMDEAIDKYIEEIYSEEILCFMFFIDNRYKWICTSIIADKIKQKYADSIVIMGGINYKNQAINYLQYFNQFDFAIWGEVEKVMLDLCNYLIEENKMYENLLRLAFRRYNIILTSGSKKEYIIPLTDVVLRPDYSDYFEQKSRMEISLDHLPVISIETQRKHRHKPISTVVSEILYFIEKYQIYTFRFSDDDEVGGGNQHKFGQLIDALLPIKEQYPDFTISLAPIASAGINSVIVRKMMIAGFYSIRTSYVSASENLLKKYGVMSSFANNLLLVKFASLYHLILAETDVITGIPGEADEDILQAISNLYYLRFFFQNGMFTHRMRKAEVIRCDKLYKQVKANRINWDIDAFLKRFLPADYLKLDAKNANIINLMPNQVNPLWGDFKLNRSSCGLSAI